MSVVKTIRITFLGEPLSKSNSHYFFKGKVYIPKEKVEYEKGLREAAAALLEAQGIEPLAGPVRMNIDYYLSSKRTKDLPNLPKTTCDALRGIAYDDDCLITRMSLAKYYDKERPRVEITVTPAKLPATRAWPLPERFLGPNPERTVPHGSPEPNVGDAKSLGGSTKPKGRYKRKVRRTKKSK